MIFLYARITRLLKKKSYHYIVPPSPEKDKNWHPVDFSKYENFIFINNISLIDFIEKLKKILSIEKEFKLHGIELVEENNWILIKTKNLSFLGFKSLVWWIDVYSKEFNSSDRVIGYCKHKSIPSQDYLFKIDKVLDKDNFIGVFRNQKNFGIYLPNAGLSEKGNISLSSNFEINFYSITSNLPIEMIEKTSVSIDKLIKN